MAPAIGGSSRWGRIRSSGKRAGTWPARSSVLRGASIALVTVLIAQSLWSTARLIDELIVGGPHTDKAGPLLAAASVVWISNNLAFALLYWEVDSGGATARAHGLPELPDLAFPQQLNPHLAPHNWRPRFIDYLYLAFTTRPPSARRTSCRWFLGRRSR
jgi:hypothetical protein